VYLAILLISFPGYPFLAAVTSLSGAEGALSSFASLIMRVVNVCFALILIFSGLTRRRNGSSGNLIRVLLLFWAAYVIRIFFDTVYYSETLWQEPSYYWIWAIGGCLIPMMGLALTP